MPPSPVHDIHLINRFPNFHAPGFDLQRYYSLFRENNVIINAEASEVEYGDHWGPLSVKCAFRGREYYHAGSRTVAVDDASYLIFNDGKIYSSYIRSESKVQSFTINFSPAFVEHVLSSMMQQDPEPKRIRRTELRFHERLYPHNDIITPLILRLRSLSLSVRSNRSMITELFAEVLERLILSQEDVRREIDAMSPVRLSTKRELYRRLHQAKDLIDSCFAEDLTLESIARAAELAPLHCLREFKRNFHLTPHQYLTQRRLEEAKYLLASGSQSVTGICLSVGYSDLSSFSKLFKSRTGLPPERYRDVIRS